MKHLVLSFFVLCRLCLAANTSVQAHDAFYTLHIQVVHTGFCLESNI